LVMKMSRKTISLIIMVVAAVSAVVWIGPGNRLARSQPLSSAAVGTSVGATAPDVLFMDLDGKEFQLSELRGKVVMINLFASWCAPCILETPHLVDFFNEHQDDMIIVGLNFGERRSAVEAYRDQFEVNYPLIHDPDGAIGEVYRGLGLPTSWFIDGEGVVRYVHAGPMTPDFIQRILQDIQS
jgi:thiol-disulfide isomerase/thioredoxin